MGSAPEATLLAMGAAAISWLALKHADAQGLWLVLDRDQLLLVGERGFPVAGESFDLVWFRSLLFLSLRCGGRSKVVILARDALPEDDWRRLRLGLRQMSLR